MSPRHRRLLVLVVAFLALPLVFRLDPARAARAMAVTVHPHVFSPNGDGRLDETTITVEVDLPSTVEIQIRDGTGTVHRSWTEPATPDGPATVVWDGRGEAGPIPDGTYEVFAHDADPAELNGEGTAPVALDTREPSFDWMGTRPRVVERERRVRFRFRAHDPSGPLAVTVETEDPGGPVGSTEASVSPSEASVSWRSGRLFPGNYATRFRLADAAGNVRHAGPFWWRVERSRPGRVWTHVPGSGRRVALTIDDCHFPGAWASMLSTLEDRNAGATFFCPGKEMLQDPGLVRRTIRDGHMIGSHGWDHANLARMPADAVERRVRSDARALWKIAHRTTAPFMRPPEGAYTRSTVRSSGGTGHPRVIMWDVDTRDWTSPGVSSIVSRAVRGAKRGSIILLHTKPQTATALPAIISGLRERGLEPVGLPELFRAARH